MATQPPMSELTRVFGRIGLLSFGGPAAQIALMHRELVETRDWLDDDTFLRALSLCTLLPGPEAMQLATYAGWRLRGVAGGLVAGGLFVLPGAVVIAALAALYVAAGDLPLAHAAFLGIKAAVVVIVVQALAALSRRALHGPADRALAAGAFVAIFALGWPFPLIIAIAALWGWFTPNGDISRAPNIPHRPVDARPLRTVAIWLPLWLGPLLVLTLTGPPLLADLGWFFAWLAVITFGGAYAVLAYMTQTVVQDHGWITTAQMIDALGLAETTPGPLILVTQFVATLAGAAQGGAGFALAAGGVALWATFVPCFLWIFLAAPQLDRLAALPRLSAALRAITAAVVGVILNLSVWFALNVFFGPTEQTDLGPLSLPLPAISGFDARALALAALAALLLIRIRLPLPATLAVMAAAGVILGMVP